MPKGGRTPSDWKTTPLESAQWTNLSGEVQALALYSWPGNIRELENVLAGCCMMAEGQTVDVYDLPEEVLTNSTQAGGAEGGLLSLAQVKRSHARRVLEHVGGNRSRAAHILGIDRATLYRLDRRSESLCRGSR